MVKPAAVAAVALTITAAAASFAPSTTARGNGLPPKGPSQPGAEPPDRLAGLRAWENETRARTDFVHAETSATGLGPDPYVLRRLLASGPSRYAGLLRGRSAVVLLDGDLHEVQRLPAPEGCLGLAVGHDGEVTVVGERASSVARYRLVADRLVPDGTLELPGVRAMRDVAAGPEGAVYVVEEHDGRLITLWPSREGSRERRPAARRADEPLCHGPVHVLRTDASVLVDCLIDHAIVIRPVDATGLPLAAGEVRIVHDGPMWGFAALPDGDGLLVAVGGVEDHPLDRREGSFGFIDSFVTLYRVHAGRAETLAVVNTSEKEVVTPKALSLARGPGGRVDLTVAAYGSARMAGVRWTPGEWATPAITTRAIPPGSVAIEPAGDGAFVLANPLLDAWVRAGDGDPAVVAVDDAAAGARSGPSRLGEALFFTTLLAPWDSSEGRLSRFTCETCHFEGYVDGRTHFTGRGEVHATTKPLLGLFNNRPHFSRALDPDMTTMVNNEFRVAGAKSGHDSWFSLAPRDFPWLGALGVRDESLEPAALRGAFMAFLMDFRPRPNPSALHRDHFTAEERAGAEVFRDRCESCHEARLVTDEPSTRVSFASWEAMVLSPAGPIVWAHDDYEMTGVVPYVNERGARVPSLRRLYKKYPYFTNGSAKGLGAVLDRAAFAGGLFFHDDAPPGAVGLPDTEKAALAAFLDLL